MPATPDYRLSKRADADLAAIADYTINRFGIEQAWRYRDALNDAFQMLKHNPLRGRSAERLATDLRRFEVESHVVFYRPELTGLLIVRVLHQRMDFERHSMTDD